MQNLRILGLAQSQYPRVILAVTPAFRCLPAEAEEVGGRWGQGVSATRSF